MKSAAVHSCSICRGLHQSRIWYSVCVGLRAFVPEQDLHTVAMRNESTGGLWQPVLRQQWRCIMWLLVAREPRQDAPQWMGRRGLAALDAVVWPALALLMIYIAPEPLGVFGPVAFATVLVASLVRLRRAICRNHRYWFTTSRWGGVALGLMLVGAAIKAVA